MNRDSVPVAMIGVGVAGVAWMAVRGCQARFAASRPADRQGDAGGERDDDTPYLFAEYDRTGESANGYTPGLAYGEADLLRGLVRPEDRQSVRRRLHHFKDSASRQIRRSAWVGQERLRYWVDSNPLLFGAAAAVFGAAIGSALVERHDSSR